MGGGFSGGGGPIDIKITYLRLGPAGDNLTECSDESVFGPSSLANGFGVGDMVIVLVQAPLEEVQVSGLETLSPILHELDLWRDRHCDEASRGCRLDVIFLGSLRKAQGHLLYTHWQDVRSTCWCGARSTAQLPQPIEWTELGTTAQHVE